MEDFNLDKAIGLHNRMKNDELCKRHLKTKEDINENEGKNHYQTEIFCGILSTLL